MKITQPSARGLHIAPFLALCHLCSVSVFFNDRVKGRVVNHHCEGGIGNG